MTSKKLGSWTAGVFLLVANTALWATINQETGEKAQATELIVVDEQLKERVQVKMDNNQPSIGMLDRKGHLRLFIFLLKSTEHPTFGCHAESLEGTWVALHVEDNQPAVAGSLTSGERGFELSAATELATLKILGTPGRGEVHLRHEKVDGPRVLITDRQSDRAYVLTKDFCGFASFKK